MRLPRAATTRSGRGDRRSTTISFRQNRAAMKYPDLTPIYAHLLCNEELSEATEDASQHLVQRAVDTGLFPDAGDEDDGWCSEPTMMRLLEVSAAAADLELRRLAKRLEALLLREFPTKLVA